MYARFTAFVVWALLAGSVVFWLLKLAVEPLPAPAHAAAVAVGGSSQSDLSRLLGSAPVGAVQDTPAVIDGRFILIGVVAPKAEQGSREGVALIAVEGGTPRPYRIGAAIDGVLTLLSVSSRSATLGQQGLTDAPTIVLQLQAPSAALNAPILSGQSQSQSQSQMVGVPSTLPSVAPAAMGALAPVVITPGLNPVPSVGGGAEQTARPIELRQERASMRGEVSR